MMTTVEIIMMKMRTIMKAIKLKKRNMKLLMNFFLKCETRYLYVQTVLTQQTLKY